LPPTAATVSPLARRLCPDHGGVRDLVEGIEASERERQERLGIDFTEDAGCAVDVTLRVGSADNL
jgi:hypothetical protein